MRIRTIKPEFFLHSGIHDAEQETRLPLRLAFIGLWCAADREGRFKWEPRRLKIQILPYDEVDFSRVLHALTTRGFIMKYVSGDSEYGVIPTFGKHQVINNRERESDYPEPLEFKDIDACSTRAPRDDHADKAEGKGREQGKEGNMEGAAAPKPPRTPKGKKSAEPVPAESMEACQRYAIEIGAHWRDGSWFWFSMEEKQWRKNAGKEPVLDWKATLRTYHAGGWLPSGKTPGIFDAEEPPPWIVSEAEGPQVIPDLDNAAIREGFRRAREEQLLAEHGSDELEKLV